MKKTTNTVLQIALLGGVWAFISVYQAVGTFFFSDWYYAFRAYELARVSEEEFTPPCRPYFVWDGMSVGDLSHLVGVPQLLQYRHERFTTDEYGFRNPVGTLDRPCDVVIVGDSAAAGFPLEDDRTLAALIRGRTGLGCYNAGLSTLSEYAGDRRFTSSPPRLVIFVNAERNLRPGPDCCGSREFRWWSPPRRPPGDYGPEPAWRSIRAFRDVNRLLDRPRVLRRHTESIYKGFLYAVGLYRFPPQINRYDARRKLFFFTGGVWPHLEGRARREVEMEEAAQDIKAFHDVLAGRGTRMLVVVSPEKETVYHDLVPALRGVPVNRLLDTFFARLEELGVEHLRTHELLQAYRAEHPDKILYVGDDTHMNERGQELVFEAIRGRLPPP